jgi:NAD(P)-dependent dehydrogenase (short-subunit alcohol dehydrogenase family)
MSQFAGKVVLVTGAAAGLGLVIAREFKARGARTFVVDDDPHALAAIAGEGFDAIRADVRREADMAQAARTVQTRCAQLDVLVNNAGGFTPCDFAALDAARWRAAIELNLDSVFVCAKAFVPLLAAGGCTVNISSSLARIAEPAAPAYCAAKAGVEMLTRCLALELAARRIRVVAVAPGPVEIEGAEKCGAQPVKDREGSPAGFDERRFNPSGRFARPAEVAALVCFVASSEAGFMTGNVVSLDGGESAIPAAWSVLHRLLDSGRL